MLKKYSLLLAAIVLAGGATDALAAVSAEQAATLKSTLTRWAGGRQRRRHHPRLDRRHHPGAGRLQGLGPAPHRPLRCRPAAVHHHQGQPRAVQGQPHRRRDRPVQRLPGKLPDAGLPDPALRLGAAVGLRQHPEERHHRQAAQRRQRVRRRLRRHPVPHPAERPGGDLEPHHPLSRHLHRAALGGGGCSATAPIPWSPPRTRRCSVSTTPRAATPTCRTRCSTT